jgi:very-short-patch-repair endonuclease
VGDAEPEANADKPERKPRNRRKKQSFPVRTDSGEPHAPPAPHLIRGQKPDPHKTVFARQLRRDITPAESHLWQHLRGNRLRGLHFRRQQVIHGFIADFYCHAAGVVVEVDGGIHDAQLEADESRDRAFAQLGLLTLRVCDDNVLHNTVAVLERIFTACADRIHNRNAQNAALNFLPSLQGGAGGGSSESVT